MQFRLLGSIEVWDGDRRVDIGHARQRCVLTVLLLDAGRVVPTATLLDRVWGNEPPDSAVNVVYAYIARLRKALAPSGVRLTSRSGGYVLDVDPDTVDVHRFGRLVASAEGAEDADRRAAVLDEALATWRGTPFADVTSPWLTKYRQTLADQYLSASIARNDAYLAGGRHAALVGPLRDLVAERPDDERPVAQLMLALYRSGRPSQALEEYQLARQRMADQLGSDPSRHLRHLQQRILRDDPDLALAAPPAHAALPAPASLPHDVPDFVGRHVELARLDALVPGTHTHRTVVISVIDGTAGVGKTALVVHWCHRVKADFPDGNLYADLHGFGPGPPALPEQVLDGFLAALDVARTKIPTGRDAKAALFRSLLAERRMLVVLDNAADPQQVRPLLPGTATCLVVVTSRRALAGLTARNRAHRISLGVLPIHEAVLLLAQFIGPARVAAEPDIARELAVLCACLPVALCVAGERAAAQPDLDLAKLVAQLRTAESTLDLLDADGDPETAVRAVFSWSYNALPADAARMFRLVGLHPGRDLDLHGTAALAATDLNGTQRLLDVLLGAHLIEAVGWRRFTMHDLLRAYAAERATVDDAADERHAALTRLFDHYVANAAAAMDVLAPAERRRRPQASVPAISTALITDAADASAWLDAERTNLVAASVHSADSGWSTYPELFAGILWRYLANGAHYIDAVAVHSSALRVARHHRDRPAEGTALLGLAQIHLLLGRADDAHDHFEHVITIFRAVGDRLGEARSLLGLGIVCRIRAQYRHGCGFVQHALSIFEELGDRLGAGDAHGTLGDIYLWSGEYALACSHLQQAFAIYTELGHRVGIGQALGGLGDLFSRWGRPDDSYYHYQRALDIFRGIGDRRLEARALNGLGDTRRAVGNAAEAIAYYESALVLARDADDPFEQAHAFDGIAHHLLATGDMPGAHKHWRDALEIYTGLGVPDADRIRRCLSTLDGDHQSGS